ncbi:MAG: radical SAM protein [Thermodesulfobacteriota bacterium]
MSCADVGTLPVVGHESPEYVRLSLAAAMTLGFVPGWFHRNAKLRCVNLLLTYDDGCKASCAFCGLAREKDATWTAKKFIRVPWKTFRTADVVEAIKRGPSHVGRVCISMITHPRCRDDVLAVCKQVVQATGLPASLLISPSVITGKDLAAMKDAGADRIGVAIDGATEEIFDRFRGKPVNGPHRWDRYWKIYEKSIEVFGRGMAGVHLICGLGETEHEMVEAIYRARAVGGSTHLFSFFPEKGSALENHTPPPIGAYRRIQLARWLIDHDLTVPDRMTFDGSGRILDFGVTVAELDEAIRCGEPFETSGCPGPDGKTACNRPYGNEKPGPDIRNFPFSPDDEDLKRIIKELKE